VSERADLLDRLVGDDEWSRHAHMERLRTEGAEPGMIEEIADFLEGDDPGRRSGARMALAALASPASPTADAALTRLSAALRSSDADLRVMAASALGESGNDRAVGPLISALEDDDPNVVAATADALGALSHPSALRPLVSRLEDSSSWVRLAAVVAIGRLRDPAALPALEQVIGDTGLEGPLVEAVRAIGEPAGLRLLENLYSSTPIEALEAAGEILVSHPDVPAPGWVEAAARQNEEALHQRLLEREEPADARLLGLAGTDGAADALIQLALPPRRSEAAIAGLLALSPDSRTAVILRHVAVAEPEDQVLLLSLLPPLQETDSIAALVPLLADPTPRVRAAAAEALSRSPARHSLHVLTEELDRENVAPEVVRAVGSLGQVACVALTPLLRDRDPAVRAAAADALGRCADPGLSGEMRDALDREADPAARRALLRSLARLAGADAVPVLTDALGDPDPETHMVIIESLGATRSLDAVGPLEAALDGPPEEVLAAIRALGELGASEAGRLVEPFLRSEDLERRRTAVSSIVRLGLSPDLSTVVALAHDPDAWIRGRAVCMLAERGAEARDILQSISSDDPDPAVRAEARRAIDGAP
jgi:cellulose synthase operon protein C